MPRLDDLLLVVLAVGLAIVLIRSGHGAQGAGDVIRARTVVFQTLRLTVPNVPEGARLPLIASMTIHPNGDPRLSFIAQDRWWLGLTVDQKGEPDVSFLHSYRSKWVTSLRLSLLSSSGSPYVDLRKGDGSRSVEMNMPRSTAALTLGGVTGIPVMIHATGSVMGPASIRLESRSEHSLLSLDYLTDRQSSILLSPKKPALSSMLGIPEGGPPGLELHRDDRFPAVEASLDATGRSFIRQNDRATGQSLTIH
ncbi:MAG: hypothetical protein ACYC61_07600 [Isosphaeraceae bacterium]